MGIFPFKHKKALVLANSSPLLCGMPRNENKTASEVEVIGEYLDQSLADLSLGDLIHFLTLVERTPRGFEVRSHGAGYSVCGPQSGAMMRNVEVPDPGRSWVRSFRIPAVPFRILMMRGFPIFPMRR